MIIQEGDAIGYLEVFLKEDVDRVFEIAIWTENEGVGFFDDGPGYYSVFRVGYWDIENELTAAWAELFCFYDGKNPNRDDPKNPKIFSKTEAITFMQQNYPEYEVI
jgi:hypothetical protein